ncbi:HAMP domain-containing protein [candidate division TA06 bacterium]|nr:HAMP domain-containing protein [candidate division TA06 bacterium]
MSKIFHSLQTKLTLSFVLLIVVISGMVFFYTFRATKKALKDQLRNELMSTAAAVSAVIDGNVHAGLKPGDENTPEFRKILEQLRAVQGNNPGIKYIYTMRRTQQGPEFVVDADYGTGEDTVRIGQFYEEGLQFPQLLEGFEKTSADYEMTTDQWGVVLSGYSPIRDSLGNPAGLVGIDMDSKDVVARLKVIQNSIYYLIGIAIILAGVIVLLFSQTIIRDINKLNQTANQISMGNMNINLDVKRKDEIGDLAESFSRMEASLKIMMNQDENPNESEK